jgi:hypothetical protein
MEPLELSAESPQLGQHLGQVLLGGEVDGRHS